MWQIIWALAAALRALSALRETQTQALVSNCAKHANRRCHFRCLCHDLTATLTKGLYRMYTSQRSTFNQQWMVMSFTSTKEHHSWYFSQAFNPITVCKFISLNPINYRTAHRTHATNK